MQIRALFVTSVVVAVACATTEFDSSEDGDGGDSGNSGSNTGGRSGSAGEGGESAGPGAAGASDGGTGGSDGTGGSRGGAAGTEAGGGGNTGGSDPGAGGSQSQGGGAGTDSGGASSGVGGASSGVGGMGGSTGGTSGASGSGTSGASGSGTSGASGSGGSTGGSPSCVGMSSTACQGESCCTALPVPALSYLRGRQSECPTMCAGGCPPAYACGDDEDPEHTATVDAFVLDKYEVTVGRFRRFVNAYDSWRAGGNPVAGAGAHPRFGMGWQSSWSTTYLPATAAALSTAVKCNQAYSPWTATEGANETKPITCLTWFVAHAFCTWDGARLPSEAEWEGAATGGDDNRLFPWGDDTPSATLAVYGCRGNGDAGVDCSLDDILAVGSKPAGAGRYGHLDLAGSVWEWTLDYDNNGTGYRTSCNNCVENVGSNRLLRGGDWYESVSELRAQNRFGRLPSQTGYGVGVRCLRSP